MSTDEKKSTDGFDEVLKLAHETTGMPLVANPNEYKTPMQELSNVGGVLFATPALHHSVCLEYLDSWTRTLVKLVEAGIPFGSLYRGGDPYLSKVRSKLATDFLRKFPQASDFFFIDDDVGWPAEKVIEFIRRPEGVLAGIYPKKSDELDFPVHLIADTATGKLIEREDGLLRAFKVPTGFLRIKRWVLEEMTKISGIFYDTEHDHSVGEYSNIFEMGVAPDRWWTGEDYAFAQKWVDMGGEVWIDPDIQFTHRGQKVWRSTLGPNLDGFRQKAKEMKAEFDKQTAEAAE